MNTNIFGKHFTRILTILIFGIAVASANGAAGDLDTTFGGSGKMRVGVGGGFDSGNAVARQSDGKLVVAGYSSDMNGFNFSLVRYNTNGTLDATFGTNGKVVTLIGTNCTPAFARCGANAVTILADGKILAVGSDSEDFVLVKYNSNGTPDASFGSGGIVISDLMTGTAHNNAMAVQVQGNKFIVAGNSFHSTMALGGYNDGIIARYNANGTLDTTFGNDGTNDGILFIRNETTNRDFSIYALGLPGDGSIIAAGSKQTTSTRYEGAMIRLTANGVFDGTFGSDGFVINNNGQGTEAIYSLAFMSRTAGEDLIIASGSTAAPSQIGSDSMLWSYNRGNGSPDSTFGTAGRTITRVINSQNSETIGKSVKIQFTSGGVANKIVVAGDAEGSFFAARYSLFGDIDTAFGGGDGIVTIIGFGRCSSMLVQPSDNRIFLAGTVNQVDYGIARFTSGGALDTTFDGDGTRIDDVSNAAPRFIKATVIQSDGKILAAGDRVIARFNSDGSFDSSFGSYGIASTSITTNAMALQSDGKIVVTGGGIARLNTDGSIDTTFTRFSSTDPSFNAIAIQPDGAIVVAGFITTGTGSSANINFYTVRYSSSGSRDNNFGLSGAVTTDFNTGTDKAYSVAIQPDGKIVVAGESNGFFGLARYNSSDGSLDTSFSNDGKQTTSIGATNSSANAMAIRDGKILAAGSAGGDFAAARYNISDGSLDTTFDSDGKLTTPVGSRTDVGNAVAIQTDGKILIAGSTESAAGVNDFAVVRYNANGSLDSSLAFANADSSSSPLDQLYGNGGKTVIDFGGNDTANAIALDSSGRAVVAGSAFGLFGIARLSGNSVTTAASVTVSGRVLTPDGRGLTNAAVSATDAFGNTRTTKTSAFGYFHFGDVAVGQTYIFNISSKRYNFNSQILSLNEDLQQLNFTAISSNSKIEAFSNNPSEGFVAP